MHDSALHVLYRTESLALVPMKTFQSRFHIHCENHIGIVLKLLVVNSFTHSTTFSEAN